MSEQKQASVAEIKRYFEIASMQEMKNQWQVLTEAEKEFFRVEVGKVINAG
jgi:hypothetical protein